MATAVKKKAPVKRKPAEKTENYIVVCDDCKRSMTFKSTPSKLEEIVKTIVCDEWGYDSPDEVDYISLYKVSESFELKSKGIELKSTPFKSTY